MPTIDIHDKICPHCGGIRWVTYKRIKTLASGDKKTYICYICAKKNIENGNKWRKNHVEEFKKTAREYVKLRRKIDFKFAEKERQKNKVYHKQNSKERQLYRKKWANSNVEKNRAYSRISSKKQIINLTDYYVCKRIINKDKLFKEDIPQDLIELKRKQLILTRQIKNNGKKQQSSKNSN